MLATLLRVRNRLGLYSVRLSHVLSRKGLYPFLAREYGKIQAGERVLTVGAGGKVNALLETYARHRRFLVVSFDIDANRQPDILGDICDYDFGTRRFDVVVMSEVLQAVPAPHRAIENLYNALRDGGRLILTTPFLIPICDRPHDYYRFTRYGLEFLLKEFCEVHIGEINSWSESIAIMSSRLIVEKRGSARLLPSVFLLWAFCKYPFALLLGKIIHSDFATTGYVVTARKSTQREG